MRSNPFPSTGQNSGDRHNMSNVEMVHEGVTAQDVFSFPVEGEVPRRIGNPAALKGPIANSSGATAKNPSLHGQVGPKLTCVTRTDSSTP